MERAVHGLQLKLLSFCGHRGKHVAAVEVQVARSFPQVQTGYVWRVKDVVATLRSEIVWIASVFCCRTVVKQRSLWNYLFMLLFPISFNKLANNCALRVPENQPTPSILLYGEEAEGLAQCAVISTTRLLRLQPVRLQLLLCFPSSAVNTLPKIALLPRSDRNNQKIGKPTGIYLKHRPRLVAPPVGTRHRLQLNGTRVQLSSTLQMRSST